MAASSRLLLRVRRFYHDEFRVFYFCGNNWLWRIRTRQSYRCFSSAEYDKYGGVSDLSTFTVRTHTCGELRAPIHVGQTVYLCGWIQFKRMPNFVTLRDGHGVTQIRLVESTAVSCHNEHSKSKSLEALPLESVVGVRGVVAERPPGQANKRMLTGDIEVLADEVDILGRCDAKLPFLPRDYHKVTEALRLTYRYLDFRNVSMQQNLRLRSQFVMKIREFLCNRHGFVDVETPTLFRRTPGGAQEFVVPTREPNHFYSLTQSPQQFKQLLMIGAVDRYFQIARCYRDESSRTDRQPEFTQVDIEMSFTSAEGIMSLVEQLFAHCWPTKDLTAAVSTPFPRIPFHMAERNYGTDKPDTRFEMQLMDLSESLASQIESAIGSSDCVTRAFVAPQSANVLSKAVRNKMKDEAACNSQVQSVHFIRVGSDGQWKSSQPRLIDERCRIETNECLRLGPGDSVVLASGTYGSVNRLLGKLRLDVANLLENSGVTTWSKSNVHKFVWIVDFPLFERTKEGGFQSTHHPFTAPHPGDMSLLMSGKWDKVRGQHYDLVLNGAEVGGGSVRIHDASLQKYVLELVLKEDCASLSHLLEALASGCPPHGGIALGLDRLLAILCHATSIRDVIAFPKSSGGKDLMSGAPAPISDEEKRLYHL